MALYTKFSVQRALLLKVEDLEVLEGLQSHLGSYVKAQSSGSLYRPISTEGFKSLNRLEGWSAFAQISLFKTTTLFSSATGNIYILSTCLMSHDFFSCQPPTAPLLRVRVWQSSSWRKLENISLGSTGVISQPTAPGAGPSLPSLEQCHGPYFSLWYNRYLSTSMNIDQTEPCLRKSLTHKFHLLLHIPMKLPWGQDSPQCSSFTQLQAGFR